MAQIDNTVDTKIPYAISNCNPVSKSPEFPTIYPIRKNKMELNIDKHTGANTPLKVPRVLCWSENSCNSGPSDW